MTLRILVTGSRDWPFPDLVKEKIEDYLMDREIRFADLVIVHGACPTGADKAANDWAREYDISVERWPADWSKGRSAGPARNKAMVAAGADVCLAFQKNDSRGTQNTIDLCEAAGIPVRLVMM